MMSDTHWQVAVEVDGLSVLIIGDQHLSGIDDIEKLFADIVRLAAGHLLSFIGPGEHAAESELIKLRESTAAMESVLSKIGAHFGAEPGDVFGLFEKIVDSQTAEAEDDFDGPKPTCAGCGKENVVGLCRNCRV